MIFLSVVYFSLLIVFLVFAGILLRHILIVGYLAPQFRWVMTVIGLFAAIVLGVSVWFFLGLYRMESGAANPLPLSPPLFNF